MTTGDGTNFIASAFGRTRSGKSHWLAMLARQHPRRLVSDFIGEFVRAGKHIPGAVECYTLEETVNALLQARGSWTVLTLIQPEEIASLLQGIMYGARGGAEGFANKVGGIAFECGEIDRIAVNNAGVPAPVIDIFQRGRHYGVSAFVGTQRPRQTHRVVTAQSHVIGIFKQHEKLDIDYFADLVSDEVAARIARLPMRQHIEYFTETRTWREVTEDGRTIAAGQVE